MLLMPEDPAGRYNLSGGFWKRRGSPTTERDLLSHARELPQCARIVQEDSVKYTLCSVSHQLALFPDVSYVAGIPSVPVTYSFWSLLLSLLVTVSVDIHSKRHFDIHCIFQKADGNFIPVLFCSARYICWESTYDMYSTLFLVALCAV